MCCATFIFFLCNQVPYNCSGIGLNYFVGFGPVDRRYGCSSTYTLLSKISCTPITITSHRHVFFFSFVSICAGSVKTIRSGWIFLSFLLPFNFLFKFQTTLCNLFTISLCCRICPTSFATMILVSVLHFLFSSIWDTSCSSTSFKVVSFSRLIMFSSSEWDNWISLQIFENNTSFNQQRSKSTLLEIYWIISSP